MSESSSLDVMNKISKDGESFLDIVHSRICEIFSMIQSDDFEFEESNQNVVSELKSRPPNKIRKMMNITPGVSSDFTFSDSSICECSSRADSKLEKLGRLVHDKICNLLDDIGAIRRYAFVKKSTREFTNEQIIIDAIQNLILMEKLLFKKLEKLPGIRTERMKIISKAHEPLNDHLSALILFDLRTLTVLKSMASKLIELYLELADLTQGIKEEKEFANNFFKNLYT
ncbi:unnamed protein product [Lepeophtheirus salmonis]|uniref:(salmon louse) hypothetical protein n=1 Tax=Lepeophtheirus salmonis TaxID=72036 RepID=A0A0K2UJM0_LEPSM|nr:unnamed protein product [Lepeophtheirus salmonis]CAF2886003.1 unnamed protein product [Lepeophtheirus salmonis]